MPNKFATSFLFSILMVRLLLHRKITSSNRENSLFAKKKRGLINHPLSTLAEREVFSQPSTLAKGKSCTPPELLFFF